MAVANDQEQTDDWWSSQARHKGCSNHELWIWPKKKKKKKSIMVWSEYVV